MAMTNTTPPMTTRTMPPGPPLSLLFFLLLPTSLLALYLLSYNPPPTPTPNLTNPLLRRSPRSRCFSARAAALFNTSCTTRFFMTWITVSDLLSPRELLAIQTIFRSHPAACLLIASPSMDSPAGSLLLSPFLSLGLRIAAATPDLDFLLHGTPALPWLRRLRRGDANPGTVPLPQNLSNLLRLALLYRYGGVYLDADVLVLRSFSGLRNSVGAQTVEAATGNWSRLNNAVMIFDRMHPLLYRFIREFAGNFDGNKWGHNGPYLVSRVVAEGVMRGEVDVMPPSAFYPVGWSRIGGLFEGPRRGRHSRWVVRKLRSITEDGFAVHLWNRRTRGLRVEEGSVVGRIMRECCLFCESVGAAMEVVSSR